MPSRTGTNSNNTIDLRNETAAPPSDFPATQAWWLVDTLGGNDTVYGSKYNDSVDGGEGNDLFYGYDGRDGFWGGTGNDTAYGGNGVDNLSGDAGDDTLYGEADNDTLNGGTGQDILWGGTGNDTLIGGADWDRLHGEDGNDLIYADAGSDDIYGGAGDDIIYSSTGNDHFYFAAGGGHDIIREGVYNSNAPRDQTTYDTDTLHVFYAFADLGFEREGDDLVIGSYADATDDGFLESSVTIEGFYLGGHYVVESLITDDGGRYNLTNLLIAA